MPYNPSKKSEDGRDIFEKALDDLRDIDLSSVVGGLAGAAGGRILGGMNARRLAKWKAKDPKGFNKAFRQAGDDPKTVIDPRGERNAGTLVGATIGTSIGATMGATRKYINEQTNKSRRK